MAVGFIPNKAKPSEITEAFIEERIALYRSPEQREKEIFKYCQGAKSSASRLYQTYLKFWNILYTSKNEKVSRYLTKVFNEDGYDTTSSKMFSVLSILGLVDVVKDLESPNIRSALPRYTFNLGPNAIALETNKAIIEFSEEQLKLRQKPWRTNKKSKKKEKLTIEEVEDDKFSPLFSIPQNNITNLFAITERIHLDFKELERRLEQRKAANPKQYYFDLRLIEHLKGEFSQLMVQVLPENEEAPSAVVENPGELSNIVESLR